MLSASKAYKQQMEQPLRNHSYMTVTIGAINQLAQRDCAVSSNTAYISNNTMLFNNYSSDVTYATLEQDFAKVDGTMFFPPRSTSSGYIYNQGAVSDALLGSVTIVFGTAYDIKGLTIQFATEAYPTAFSVTNGTVTYTYTGNTDSYWTTEDIFDGTEYITITPTTMSNGQSRMRIETIFFGIGIFFDNSSLISVEKSESVSPVTETLPSIDLSVTVNNRDDVWDVNNSSSSINYLESGQDVYTRYGYELNDGTIYWMDGCTVKLRTWQANTREMRFDCEDRISDLSEETYYGGQLYSSGITAYDLALLVLNDAGVDSRDYDLDTYLQQVTFYNPLPPVSHAECLQIIANASRCKLYVSRDGLISIKAAFKTELNPSRMTVTANEATDFSDLSAVINGDTKINYAMLTRNYATVDGSMYFLPKSSGNYLTTGFVSYRRATSSGTFSTNPVVTIALEAASTFYSLNVNFASNPPSEFIIHTYLQGVLQESYTVSGVTELSNAIEHEFPYADTLALEFTVGYPYNRIYLDSVSFGEQTDYTFTKTNMKEVPTGTRTDKVMELQVIKTLYSEGTELQSILTETVDMTDLDEYTFYLSKPTHGMLVYIDGTQSLLINDQSAYFITIDTSDYTGEHEVQINGYTYVTTQQIYTESINTTGVIRQWENPLISDDTNAALVGEWVGHYLENNAEYDITYRGEPRLDAGDYAYMENDFVDGLMVQMYENRLAFNGGALSGTVKARLATNNSEGS